MITILTRPSSIATQLRQHGYTLSKVSKYRYYLYRGNMLMSSHPNPQAALEHVELLNNRAIALLNTSIVSSNLRPMLFNLNAIG